MIHKEMITFIIFLFGIIILFDIFYSIHLFSFSGVNPKEWMVLMGGLIIFLYVSILLRKIFPPLENDFLVKKSIRKLVCSQEVPFLLESNELQFTEKYITSSSYYADFKISWDFVEKVINSDDFFAFFASNDTYFPIVIVQKDCLKETSLRNLEQLINTKCYEIIERFD